MVSLKFTIVLAVVLIATLSTVSARMYLLEIDDADTMRHKRQGYWAPKDEYRAVPSNHRPKHAESGGGGGGGVFSFVKTNKHGHVSWGVRYPAGNH
ncbi:Hypothetical predicted protein [Cloeon dipterum]|uniref:Uncharacterized protein n=1 Tax=Cloeon dipterum TaxID=197152 RepID=A0A8S1CV26_9INSE|nr:Hypothetical predicted protein [Cloeon dipterum]